MKKEYDYLIVGSGLFGSVMARQLTDAGKRCFVIEQRKEVGGNCATERIEGVDVHQYGPHIFHTSNKKVWDYINRFVEFNHFTLRNKADVKGKLISLPINLNTISQLTDGEISTPKLADLWFKEQTKAFQHLKGSNNLEEHCLSLIGKLLYETLIKGYTEKQWGKKAVDLPASIIKRLPLRNYYDDNYFSDCYQGIPKNGYNEIFLKLLNGINVLCNVNYIEEREYFDSLAEKIIFTGKIDEFCNYMLGDLEYRSLDFEHKTIEIDDYQGTAIINYPDKNVYYTRIIEHKHFYFDHSNKKTTVITIEAPVPKYNRKNIPFYPVRDQVNTMRYNNYVEYAKLKYPNVIFGGRLGSYAYQDMHVVINNALIAAEREINNEIV